MKRIVEEVGGEGLEKFIGLRVLLLCASYFYVGTLIGINDTCVLLKDASIVYETGGWESKSYKDSQRLPSDWYVQLSAIESFGAGI